MRLDGVVGPLELYIGHELEAYERDDIRARFALRTRQYWYRVFPRGSGELLRWEYDHALRPEGNNHCRNHLHVHTRIAFGDQSLDLHKVHLPTGYVIFEEVLRFLFMDLKVKPKAPDWAAKLAASEKKFREEFSPYGPPGQPSGT